MGMTVACLGDTLPPPETPEPAAPQLPTPTQPPETPPTPPAVPPPTPPQKSAEKTETPFQYQRQDITFLKFVSSENGLYSLDAQEIEELKSLNINGIRICPLYSVGQDGRLREDVPESVIIALIKKAHQAGFAVFLEPNAIRPGQFHSLDTPEHIDELYTIGLHWAEIAEEEKVEFYSPLNEPDAAFANLDLVDQWIKKSQDLRPVFSGNLVLKLADIGPQKIEADEYDYIAFDIIWGDANYQELRDRLKAAVKKGSDLKRQYNLKGFFFGEIGGERSRVSKSVQAEIFRIVLEETWGKSDGYCFLGWSNLEFKFRDNDEAKEIIKEWYTAAQTKQESASPSAQREEPALSELSPHQRLNISFFKGVWAQSGGEERALENDIEKMLNDGVNIFPVSVLYHISPDGTTEVVPMSSEWDLNPEQGYINLIRMAHRGGLGVFLELDFEHWWEDGKFLSVPDEIRNKIVENAKKTCLHWAEIGEKEQIELFSPMNEPTNVFGVKDGIKWIEDILPRIKEKYTGKTNVKLFGIEVGDFSSYGSIAGYDYVSVNVYAAGTSNEEFMRYIKDEVDPYLEDCVKRYNLKGYLFGEMGVPAENKEQAQVFEQFFEQTWDNCQGYFLCGWGPKIMSDDPFPDMRFTGYPAENVIKQWYTKDD